MHGPVEFFGKTVGHRGCTFDMTHDVGMKDSHGDISTEQIRLRDEATFYLHFLEWE